MAWLAVDDDGSESLYANKPYRRTDPNYGSYWKVKGLIGFVNLPKGSIKKLIGRESYLGTMNQLNLNKKEVSPVSTSPKELKRKLTIYLLIKKWNGLP